MDPVFRLIRRLLMNWMTYRRHPYPKLYEASETAPEDLDGDGRPEEIGYRVTEQENGEVLCLLTVNGETYTANELVDPAEDVGMWNPTPSYIGLVREFTFPE